MPTNRHLLSHSELCGYLTQALRLGQFADAAILADELDRRMHLVFYRPYVAYRASLV